MKYALLQKNKDRSESIERITRYLRGLDMDVAWRVEAKEIKATRSALQNDYLWFVYDFIKKTAPEELGGWSKDDLHEFFLGEHFGWEKVEGLNGNKRMRPRQRSSRLPHDKFWGLVEFIQRFMAKLGVVIPDPDPSLRKK